MPGSGPNTMLVRTPTGNPTILASDQQLVTALCATELRDVREKADALKRALQTAVPQLGKVDQLCRISLQKPWMASFQDYRRLLSASNSLATRTVRFLHTYIHVYLPLIVDRTVPEAEKIHELQMFLKARRMSSSTALDKIRADVRKVHAHLEAVVRSRAGASDPVLDAAEAHIQTLQQDKARLADKIEGLLPMVPSATAHSVAHWASVRIILGKEGVSRAALPIVVGFEAMRKRTFEHLYLPERAVERPRATDEDPLRALRPCVLAVAVQLEVLGPRLEAFGRILPLILEHVASYIGLAERAREHCGTGADMEMRKKECAMQSAAEGYAKLADALEEYACSG